MCQTHNMRAWRGKDLHSAGTYRGTATKWINDHVAYNDSECLIWPFARNAKGYPDVNYPGMSHMLAHRVMCTLAHGPAPHDGMDAAHSCGKGHHGCMNQTHLSWKTRADNHADKLAHGTQIFGDKVHFAKLTIEQARRIKYGDERGVDLAHELNVKPMTIYNIRAGRTWKGI